MKTTKYDKYVLTFIFLSCLSIAIWMLGPLIIINGQKPLLLPEKRLYSIIILFLLWLLKLSFFDEAKPGKILGLAAASESVKKLRTLKGRFRGVIEFLKKTTIQKQGMDISLSHLPWYLFIGPAKSGKTTLLANSNINFLLSKQNKDNNPKNNIAADICDWWITREIVLVDTPGAYIISKDKNRSQARSSIHHILWNNLLNLLKKYRPDNSIAGVIIGLNLPELITQSQGQRNAALHDVKERILELKNKFKKQLPIYLIVTKCDLLPGFQEFFSDMSTEELTQNWGITLPELKPQEKLIDVFVNRFNELIKKINKQLIWRLHQEREASLRPLIKDFPLQIERLKESISQFLKALAIADLNLQSINLTSAKQNPRELPVVSTQLTEANLLVMQPPEIPSRPYFIKQFILNGLPHHDLYLMDYEDKMVWGNRLVYTTAASIILGVTVLLVQDFMHGVQRTYTLQNDLTQYQLYMQSTQPENHLLRALPLLNELQQTATVAHPTWAKFMKFLTFYSYKSQQTANKVYHQALQTIIIPEIKNDFEKYLQSPTDKNPDHLYAVLKAYLMLNDPEHLNENFIVNTIQQLVSLSLPKDIYAQLSQHIQAGLKTKTEAIPLNNTLIAEVRQQLNSLSNLELAYIILKNASANNFDSAISLGTGSGNQSIFVSKAVSNVIPNIFTANKFNQVLATEIPLAVDQAVAGNWILGQRSANIEATAIVTQLREKYLANYIDVWESLLANIQLSTPQNLPQMNFMLDQLTGDHSPFLQLLRSVQQNTNFPQILSVSPKLQALNTLLMNTSNDQKNILYQVFISLRQLHFYLQELLSAKNPTTAVFQATAQRMQIPANDLLQDPINRVHTIVGQSPEPLKKWLNNFATQTWSFMLQETSTYIETNWQTNIMAVYRSQIENRFPFSETATQEVDLQQFSHFLGKGGVLGDFYQNLLKPFVNESGKKWQWKMVDNQKLPFSETVLQQLQQAAQLQHAFFPNGDNQLHIQFTLQPLAIDGKMKNFVIDINGQQLTYQKHSSIPHNLIWPGSHISQESAIHFVTPSNQMLSRNLTGSWGWFKLVNQALQNVRSDQTLELKFNIDGHSAKYLLFTQSKVNPFVAANLKNFKLADKLAD